MVQGDCLNSDIATPRTERMNRQFSQYELGVIVLRAGPSTWKEQYYLLHQSLPTKLSPRSDTHEQINKVQATTTKKRDSDTARPGDKGGAKHKTRFASDSTKRKQGDSNKGRCIPKKARNEKIYQRCKEHDRDHKTHNTSECHRYVKDDLPQPSYSMKQEGTRSYGSNNEKEGNQNVAQLKAEVTNIKAEVDVKARREAIRSAMS